MTVKKKVVIIGGGFGGSHAAKHLEKHFDVSLIDTKGYFEFTPGILRTLVEPTHVRNIQVLHSHYLRWAKVFVGVVKEVDDKFVYFNNRKIKYDYLIVASGSNYNSPFKDHKLVTELRARRLRNQYDKLCKARKVLIIGGGVVGVEMAGEICWKYGREKEITIVHSKEKLIERNNQKAVKYAEKALVKQGVKIKFNERVKDVKNGVAVTDKGNKYVADIVFLCVGIKPNYQFMKKSFSEFLNERGSIKVNENLNLEGKKNVFAIGDVVDIKEEKTAQNAERQADVIIHNISNMDKGKKLQVYKTKKSTLLISLGKYNAIMTMGDKIHAGLMPALLKSMVEKWEMYKKRQIK